MTSSNAAERDDLFDRPGELPTSPTLRRAIETIGRQTHDAYRTADAAALSCQTLHRAILIGAAVFGGVSVIVAIVELVFNLGTVGLVTGIEIASASLALIIVLVGTIVASQRRWYLERHRAERLRLLKYASLLDLMQTVDDEPSFAAWEHRLQSAVRKIRELRHYDMHAWSEDQDLPNPPLPTARCRLDAGSARELFDYYRERRLEFQMRYFQHKALQYDALDSPLRYLLPALFFTSVLLVFVHFIVGAIDQQHPGMQLAKVALVVIAVSLICPVVAGAIRILRSANEFARNTIRFRSKISTLQILLDRMKESEHPATIMRDIWLGEQVLEGEHREWLRLMIEAEWFG
ncbi:MAG: hypothetical protein ACREM8_04530 [Vulcanimicrobiaceae bacterium]